MLTLDRNLLSSYMTDNIIIPAKFRGPPMSGNGGYVAGVFAAALGADVVQVTLRAPTPLDRAMTVHRDGDSLRVMDGGTLIAEAVPSTLSLSIPVPASWDEALAAQAQSYSLPVGLHPQFNQVRRGVHPICFCCGAELATDEGLHVYSAPVRNGEQVAAAWIGNASFADDGVMRPEMLWTALDCPGQMAWRARGVQTGMLGRLTAKIDQPVRAGERCVVIGWTMQNEGKKYFAGTALFNQTNELCAYAKAVWIGRVS